MNRPAVRELHARTAPGVPRWAVAVAHAVPLTVLPSGIWRIATTIGDGEGGRGDVPEWMPMLVYVVLLSIVSELLACTAVGLVASWGETWPRWVPVLAGREVPRLAAVLPAACGAAALTVMWTAALVAVLAGVDLRGEPLPESFPTAAGGLDAALFLLAYLPLLLWGPLLAVLTVHYHRRRAQAAPARAGAS